jgi:glycine/D-amino acid oxidase-like deaminating enzyme
MRPEFDQVVWRESAVAGPELTPLDSSASADICVIGGGYLGLSAALAAAESGKRVIVLEADEIGAGPSGRNGGQVIPGLKHDPDWLMEHYGPTLGERIVKFAGSTATRAFWLIDRYGLSVATDRVGWVQGVATEEALKIGQSRVRQWRALGADVEELDAADTARLLGTKVYRGGWIHRFGGGVNPLSFARELARVAQAKGVAIAVRTRATKLVAEDGKWRVETDAGHRIAADKALVATNSFANPLVKGVGQTFVAMNSFQIGTEPLTGEAAATIMPEGHVSSDTRRLLIYFRRTPDGRLILGGRGPLRAPKSIEDWAHLEATMGRMFPVLGRPKITHRWYGAVAVTPDYMPHLHQPAPGLVAMAGCQGRGIGLQTSLGQDLGAYLATGDADVLPFPFSAIRPIPFYPLRQIGVRAMIGWSQFLDAMEARRG